MHGFNRKQHKVMRFHSQDKPECASPLQQSNVQDDRKNDLTMSQMAHYGAKGS